MKKHFALAMIIALFVTFDKARADNSTPAPDPTGNLALAEEFASLAHRQLFLAPESKSSWSQSAALIGAAARLNPDEPRFARELVRQLIYLHDVAGATDALLAYRRLVPADQNAQVQQIDLYLGRMQQADEKIKYLEQLLGRVAIPPAVRSDAAARCAALYADRAQQADALRLLTTALTLNPLNMSALHMRFALTRSTATPLDTLQQTLAMLKANPLDSQLCTMVGRQLADFGLTDDSLKWFGVANRFSLKSGILPSPEYAIGASSELLIDNQPQAALNLINQYTTIYGADPDAWTICLVALRSLTTANKDDAALKAAQEKALLQTQIVLSNNLAIIRSAAGEHGATTRPVDSTTPTPLPDLSGDLAFLRQAGTQVGNDYLATLTALAWYDLYFKRDATAADPILDQMAKLLTDRDVQLARLRGWRQYVAGDTAGATTKLSAVADRDPLAALGLILIDLQNPADHDHALISAKQLLQSHPSGPVGTILAVEFAPLGLKVGPTGNYVPIQQAIQDFPLGNMRFADEPSEFYSIRVEPVNTSVEYGQPVLVRVTLTNDGIMDMSIGPDCALHPELLFNAIPVGHVDQTIMAAAFDQMDMYRVLLTGQTITTVVRVDDDALYPFLYDHPQAQADLDIGLITNPIVVNSADNGQPPKLVAKPGLAGLMTQTHQPISRQAVPLDQPAGLKPLLADFDKQDGGHKIRMLQAIAVYLAAARQVKPTSSLPNPEPAGSTVITIGGNTYTLISKAEPADLKVSMTQLIDQLAHSTSDATPAVAAWAKYLLATGAAGDDGKTWIEKLAHDPDWTARLLALSAAQQLSDGGHAVAAELSADTDSTVRAAAVAIAQSPLPASRPTTAPGN